MGLNSCNFHVSPYFESEVSGCSYCHHRVVSRRNNESLLDVEYLWPVANTEPSPLDISNLLSFVVPCCLPSFLIFIVCLLSCCYQLMHRDLDVFVPPCPGFCWPFTEAKTFCGAHVPTHASQHMLSLHSEAPDRKKLLQLGMENVWTLSMCRIVSYYQQLSRCDPFVL